MARAAMLDTGAKTAVLMGYGPGGKNATVLGFIPIPQSKVQEKISEGVAEAMQGYNPAAPGPVQGPPSPAQQRSEAPFGSFVIPVAGGRDVGAPPTVESGQPGQLPGRAEWESSRPGSRMGSDPNVVIEGPEFSPPAPPPAFRGPDPEGRGRTIDPDIFPLQRQEQDLYQQLLDPRGWQQASLLDFLQGSSIRALAKGGRVAKHEPVVVGEEGPEFFVPDEPGTVWPHIPQPGKGGKIDRWPKIPAPEYPGRYGGVEREILRQTRDAQDPSPGLMEMIDSGRLRLDQANWDRMLNDPDLIALGRSRMDDRREGGSPDPGPAVAAGPPDPEDPMAQALGYGSIVRRPMRIGRQSYR
jgi:hypothetical protein